jgi:hypothetical protein
MKSRVIAAGATVIALALGGPAQAMAAGPGELVSPVTGHTEATVNSPAGKVTVEGNVKTPPVALPSPKKPHAGEVKPIDNSSGSLEVNRHSGKDTSEVYLGVDRKGASLYAGQRRKGSFEVETQSRAGRKGVTTAANAFAKPMHKRGLHARDVKEKGASYARRAPHKGMQALKRSTPSGGSHHGGLAPLRTIGREVGNPIGLSLAGWLTLLFGGLCVAVGQAARGRRRLD